MEDNALATLDTTTASAIMSAPGGIVRSDCSVWEVVERFLTGPARHVVVVDSAGHYNGVIGTRHLAGLWPLDVKQLKASEVESLGCAAWIALSPDDDLRTCAQTLTEHHLDAVPVLDAEARVIGVVTARDITRAIADAPNQRQRIWQE
ncbi:MAG TPA: CBS domain-containing protein [Actinocrinis sp.]|uniref:CBS domain-containing protein n=1 Tax=Actinocrinis sp. TaxID=1920516 RepID=UPI002DDCD832|nr:CBS domain-containing protein [Actinocrinis sp.]HEV2344675.1 CBS domain-containing protein [Actinocrinis sp.]